MKKAIKILALIMAILLLGLALFSCSEKKNSDEDDDKSSKKTVPLSEPDEAAKALKSNGYTVVLEPDGERVFIRAYDGDANLITIIYCKDKSTASDLYDEAKKDLEELKEENASNYEDFSVGRDGTVVWTGTKDAIKAASKINKNASFNDNGFNDNKNSFEIEDSTEAATAHVVSWGPSSPYFDKNIAASSENQRETTIVAEVVVPQPETTIPWEIIETQIEIDGNPDFTMSITTANDPYLESINCTVDHTGITSEIDHTTYPSIKA